MRIADILPKGEENAIKSEELARMAGVSTTRQLRLLVADERAAGALILSTLKGGYFMPDDGAKGRAEITAYSRTLEARALNTLKALSPARRALRKMEAADSGQITVSDQFTE